ncbi:MAG: ribonuclease III [Dehalococcoidia bacterium]|nr:ribonuclease III [Dehalococcoidia bacterium]
MENLQILQERLGIQFENRTLLEQALVHSSFLNENPGFILASNERLEFLGDAILGWVVAEFLYRDFPEMSEGQLTGLRAALVRTETLARLGRRLKLGAFLYLGKGEQASGGGERPRIMASSFEAIVGAIYLDRGPGFVGEFLVRQLAPELERATRLKLGKDFKTSLQELVQGQWQITPEYETVAVSGPAHASEFTIEVRVGTRTLGRGTGRTKRLAEQDAARRATEALAREE